MRILEEYLEEKSAFRQGVLVLPVTWLRIVLMLDSPAFFHIDAVIGMQLNM